MLNIIIILYADFYVNQIMSLDRRYLLIFHNFYYLHPFLPTCDKKSLKIPKGQSESVYRRRTDNTMAKRKSTKGQTTIYKTYTQIQRSSNTNPTKNGGELRCFGRVSSSCSTSGTRRVNLVTNPVISRE
jgi:hypothetical protein